MLYRSEPFGEGYSSGSDLLEYGILHGIVPLNLRIELLPWMYDENIQTDLSPLIATAYMVGILEAKIDSTISISPNCNGVKEAFSIINLIETLSSEKIPLAKDSVKKSSKYSGCHPI